MNTDEIIRVAKAARKLGADFPGYLSRGEAATAALVLNRPDWLRQLNLSIAEAINRVDQDTPANLYAAQQQLQREAPLAEERAR